MNLKNIFYPLLLICFIGCAPKSIFYWGDYSETLYDYKKNPDEKTLAAHEKSLQDIITASPKKHKQVPPGVYAEYGFLLIKDGKEQEGLVYFDKEATLYPESIVFIQRLKDELARGKK
jgi:hypothetical protein